MGTKSKTLIALISASSACQFAWLSLCLPASAAETITAKRISSSLRFVPLKKLTIGPDDQYQGTMDPQGNLLVFTRKTDLIPHLCTQPIQNGEVKELLPLSSDSQEPAVSPNGELAFTYFKFHASGDICHSNLSHLKDGRLPEQSVSCLKTDPGLPSMPFWKSTNELGYLLKDNWTQESKIVVENLETGTKQILAEGKIWSPSMKVGGRYLFYNQMVNSNQGPERILVLKDLKGGLTQTIHFDLPGISGFPAVSEDEKYLYFSHYLNDTNNDNVIDGNDNSVLFRVPIHRLLTSDPVFPEQLTSIESNCSFPRPFGEVLYATCAFEGALDIYQLPSTGVVPTSWDESMLNNAHDTSRTYAERLLVLNTLKYRFTHKYQGHFKTHLEERILSNHLMADDLASSKYYVSQLQRTATPKLKDFYTLLNIYLGAREKKKLQKSSEVSVTFEREMLEAERKIERVAGFPRFKKILSGLIQTFLNQPKKSMSLLKEIHFGTTPLPLERHFFFELASWTLPRMKSLSNSDRDPYQRLYYQIYRQMMSAPEFSEETQLYYAFRFLQDLQTRKIKLPERIMQIGEIGQLKEIGEVGKTGKTARFNKNLPAPVSALLEAELIVLKLIQSSEANSQLYGDLDRLMRASRDDYFLRKAMYTRAILNFTEAQEFKYLNFVAATWLNYTKNNDTEFANAREVFTFANLDQAYASLGKKQHELAGNYFFASLTLTDDLESHYGYIQSKLLQNQRKMLDVRYKNLEDHQQIDDNMKFVEALLILADSNTQSKAQPNTQSNDVRSLELALKKLGAMEQDRDSAMRYLLIGHSFLQKLLKTRVGYEFDPDSFGSAHRNLMLAYDQGFDNDRIQASALMNLSLLHQSVQNHGLATQFFGKRKELGFISTEEETEFAWFYARSLYYNHQAAEASEVIAEALKAEALKKAPEATRMPFEERLAFYLVASGQFEEALPIYKRLIHRMEGGADFQVNLAKNYLSYGYCLFKLGKKEEAQPLLEKAHAMVEKLPKVPVSPQRPTRLIEFQPLRMKLIIEGLLAQTGSDAHRIQFLNERRAHLDQAQGLLDEWLSTVIKNDLQTAYYLDRKDSEKAAAQLEEALKHAEQLGDSSQYLAKSIQHTVVSFLTHAASHPSLYEKRSIDRIQKVVEKVQKAFDSQPHGQPVLEAQTAQLQNLWEVYSTRVLKKTKEQQEHRIKEQQGTTRNNKE